MARDQKLNVEITATDRASAEITDVARKVDRLDGESADVKVGADTSDANAKLNDVFAKLDDLGIPASNLASKLGTGKGGAAGAAVALGAALLGAANHAADVALDAENLATLTGDSVDYASRLNAVWKQTGADTKDLQDVLLQMNGVLSTNSELAGQLGINLNDGATVGQRFEQVAAALDRIPDAAKRSQIASQVFGEEGVRQYNALRNAVGDVGKAIENVPEGMAISEEDVERARQTKEEMAELKMELEGIAVAIGSVVLPAMNAMLGGLTDLMDGARELGQDLRRTFDPEADRNWARVDDFEAAEQAAAEFDRTLLNGLNTYKEVRAKAREYGEQVLGLADAEHFANTIAAEWYATNKDLSDALRDKRTMVDEAGASVDGYAEVQEIARLGAERLADATAEENERLREQRRRADEASQAIQALDTDWQNYKDELSDRRALLDVSDAFDAVETAAENATEAAKTGGREAEAAARDHERSLIDLKLRVGEYGEEVLHLPDAVITQINALIDQGKLAEAEAKLAQFSTPIWLNIKPRIVASDGSTGTSVRVDENGNVSVRHVGGLVQKGDRVRVLSGEEIEMTMPAGGRVISREDVAREQQQMVSGRRSRSGRAVSFAGATFIGTPDPRYLQQWARQMERELRGRR